MHSTPNGPSGLPKVPRGCAIADIGWPDADGVPDAIAWSTRTLLVGLRTSALADSASSPERIDSHRTASPSRRARMQTSKSKSQRSRSPTTRARASVLTSPAHSETSSSARFSREISRRFSMTSQRVEHIVGGHRRGVGDDIGVNGQGRHGNELDDLRLAQAVVAKSVEVSLGQGLGIPGALHTEFDDIPRLDWINFLNVARELGERLIVDAKHPAASEVRGLAVAASTVGRHGHEQHLLERPRK